MKRVAFLSFALLMTACGQSAAPAVAPQTAVGGPTVQPLAKKDPAQKKDKDPKKAPKCSVKEKDATHIFTVQGSGDASPLVGQAVTVQGVVVGDYQAANGLGGFFVQEFKGDDNPATSDGVFVYAPDASDVKAGDYVQVSGTVKEFNGQTQIDTVTALETCGSGYWVPETKVELPLSPADFERYEGMAVTFPQTLTVTEVFGLGRYGELALSSGGRLFNPTNGNVATTPQENAARRILLDDASTRQNVNPIPYIGPEGTRRVGDTVAGLTGVVNYAFGAYRVQPTAAPQFVNANPRTPKPADVGGTLKVSSFNVLNYFTDFGGSNRGANNQAEFERQQAKIVAAIKAIDADVLGLMEMQNNGDTALQNLVGALNKAYGEGTYAPVLTGKIGTDAIKVAIIYKSGKVNRVGAYQLDNDPILDRPTLAQTFQQKDGNGVFTLAVNHFKSKGSCPTSGDVDAGQGCWNGKRVQQARLVVAFAQKLRDESGDADVLLMGDLNSYGAEDPIKTLQGAGFESLNLRVPAPERYSYVFNGESGYLDHALASENLSRQVSGITEWHINSDEPIALDYNVEFKQNPNCTSGNPAGSNCNGQDLYAPTPFRSSDHDPVVVGLKLSADPLRAVQPTLSVTPPAGAQVGQSVNFGIDAKAAEGSTLSALEVNWGDGRVQGLPTTATSAAHTFDAAGTYTVGVKATDANGESASQSVSVTVRAAPVEGSGKLVISQVYGGGGNSGAPYQNDFVELFNAGKVAVSLEGLSVQYGSATGSSFSNVTALPAREVQPGGYFLVQMSGGTNGAPLPTPDATGTAAMAAASGKVALVKGTAAVANHLDANVLDFVGYGSANDAEGSPSPALSNTTSALRAGGGCTDTDANSADFTTAAPAPRNGASPANVCP